MARLRLCSHDSRVIDTEWAFNRAHLGSILIRMEYDTMYTFNPETANIDEIEAWYGEREKTLFRAVMDLKGVLNSAGDNRPSENIEAVRLAYWLLNIASEGDDVPEYYADVKLNGIALGQIIMEHTNPDGLVKKRLWFDVAEHIGPDFAQGMYHAAVFVSKVA